MKIGPKEAQLKALREQRQIDAPRPSLAELRELADRAAAPKPPKVKKPPLLAPPDEIPEGKRRCPMCDGSGITDETVAHEERVLTEKEDPKKVARRKYMREYMRGQKAKKAKEGK